MFGTVAVVGALAGCSASTILSGADNHVGRFEAAGVGVLFGVLVQVCPSFWLSLMVVAGISS